MKEPAANPPPAPVVIIGAGIAGLSAAWELARAGCAGVLLIESAARPGGVMMSEASGGFLLEHGPDSWLSRKSAAAELCRELGLGAGLVGTLAQPGGAQILHRGRLRPLPAGWSMLAPTRLAPVLRSPLFSWGTKARLAVHWRRAPPASPADESVGEYLRRRFGTAAGQAIAETIAGPLLGGVYGGDAEALSLAAISSPAPPSIPPATAGEAAPSTLFTSLRAGMGSLAEALAAHLPSGALRRNCPARALAPTPGGCYRVELQSGPPLMAQAVILATPAWSAAALLVEMEPELAALLAAIPYTSSVNVNLGYAAAPALPPGFGFLAPRAEGHHLLACTFAHQKFPHRAPAGGALVRLFYAEEVAAWSEARIEELARRELRDLLGVAAAPDLVRIRRWPRAMPQYTVGFAARAAAIAAAVHRHPGLQLAGNAYGGIGVPDCIESGRAAARALLPSAGGII